MIKAVRIRRMKAPLSCHPMVAHLFPQPLHQASFSRLVVLTLILCSFTKSQSASVDAARNTNNNHHNIQFRNRMERRVSNDGHHQPTYFVDQNNEYESGVSILDDDTLRLSLAIDDDSNSGGLNAPSSQLIEPKVYLRVSGESGMIRPDNQNNEVQSSRASSQKVEARARDLQEDNQEDEDDETEDDDMNDNYHHHFPYIEAYREKYVKPELHYEAAPSLSNEADSSSSKKAPASTKPKQVWSEIIAQVTTPSSFNEINSSASEHRLADFQFRSNLPSYFYNKYSSYSEEDLENVADLDDDHSKYFVKTRPRSVTTSGSNIYSNFYYEPPSFSTKSVPIPVKTNRNQLVFASAKPHANNHHNGDSQHLYVDDHEEDVISYNDQSYDDHELPQQDTTMMTTILPNFTSLQKPNDTKKTSYKVQTQTNASNRTLDASTSQSILSKVTVNTPDSGPTPQPEEKSETTTSTTILSEASPTTEATTTTTDATSIPGVPGVDYPILDEIPQTGFDCKNQRYKGFFADIDAKCQAWHYCDFTDGHSTFLCPNGTLFSQVLLTCDWWFNVDCEQAKQLYVLNERLYRYIKPPKPSFPEDFTGEHVDKWLIQQLQMGLLPKVRKKSKAKLVTLPPPRPTTASEMQSSKQN